jgi:hypothetical protein
MARALKIVELAWGPGGGGHLGAQECLPELSTSLLFRKIGLLPKVTQLSASEVLGTVQELGV